MWNLFTDPLDSQDLHIYVVRKLSGIRKIVSLENLTSKYVILPFKNDFVVMPQMHMNDVKFSD